MGYLNDNLPPGVTENMIPGNRTEDAEWEYFHEAVDKDCEKHEFTPEEAWETWRLGVAVVRG